MKLPYRLTASFLLAGLLSACGGGGISLGIFDDDHDHDHVDFRPFASGRAGSVVVSGASDPALNGTYSASDVLVSHVVGVRGNPDTCRVRFDGLREPTSGRVMAGEIRYLPDVFTVVASIVAVGVEEFGAAGGPTVTLDRTSNAVVFGNVLLPSLRGNGHNVTLTGNVPLRNDSRPSGC